MREQLSLNSILLQHVLQPDPCCSQAQTITLQASGKCTPAPDPIDIRAEFMGPLKGNPGYEGYLNDRVAALPEVMKDGNYSTILSGKWHLGTTTDQCPSAKGFDKVFSLLQGGTTSVSGKSNGRRQSLQNRVGDEGRAGKRCGI